MMRLKIHAIMNQPFTWSLRSGRLADAHLKENRATYDFQDKLRTTPPLDALQIFDLLKMTSTSPHRSLDF
jgi:hypothetical protein